MIVSQRDKKWSSIKLGTSDVTIGGYGCTITSLGYLVGLTPEKVNEKILSVNGYSNGNLVIWSKMAEAIGVACYRYTNYENQAVLDAISKNGAVLGEVDAKAIGGTGKHWLVMTGNSKVQDPWFGEERQTSNYTFTGYVIVVFDKTKIGNYLDNTYRGYDLSNTDSMKVCVDDHIRVAEGQLVDKSQYESIKGQLTESQKRNDDLSGELGAKTTALLAAEQSAKTAKEALQKELSDQLDFGDKWEDEKDAHDITKKTLSDYLWDVEDALKLSHPSDDTSSRISVSLGALQSQIQMCVSYEKKVSDLEKQVKKLSKYKVGIEKMSIKDCIIILIDKIKEKYGKNK